ncbi:MAG: DUF2817 domain-containing protein [Pseudobdellovibrio sp.]
MKLTLDKFLTSPSQFLPLAKIKEHGLVESGNQKYPLLSVHYGHENGPTLLISGGVHGLERIGAQLTLSLLDSFEERLQWDEALQEILKKIKVIFVPVVNPHGIFELTRGNKNGVDLMRNAPIEAEEKTHFLLGGHRYSNKIHWYRGHQIEQETQFLFDVTQDALANSNCLISIDIHSGFGFRDQIWFPYANSRKKFAQINEMFLLFELFEKTHPHHIYKIEPQSLNYLTHGDIWDYSFYNFKKANQVFLPLTLEMGSWLWVKKNPWQIFTKDGLFNPIKQHRLNRTFRRHRPLFDFLLHALYSHQKWTSQELTQTSYITESAHKKYYDK